MTSLTLGSLRRERSSTLRALRPCCSNDLWLRLDCRICRPRKRSETTTATLLASDARSARLMDGMTILALAPRTAIRNRTARSFRSASNRWISRQFRRLSRVLASKSDFLSFLRNRPPTREFSFLYPAHPAKPPPCTTILVAESQDLKPQMQSVLSGRAFMATSILTTFIETSLASKPRLGKEW